MGLVIESDSTPQARDAHVSSEIAKWQIVARAADIEDAMKHDPT
ncbi:hypothetical protein [Cupriavidus basilensis]|uniref:Uncharacterized protein n=1 Tax=Cupriavidus basilensis TaxID=68895 RepID=A0A0C4Y3Q1_9BURK|nr:hypothetical protein [Cupriavidus basilensis]AJG19882.1 hypothetical protein RR42_m2490 [Cupriavidus basilensis]